MTPMSRMEENQGGETVFSYRNPRVPLREDQNARGKPGFILGRTGRFSSFQSGGPNQLQSAVAINRARLASIPQLRPRFRAGSWLYVRARDGGVARVSGAAPALFCPRAPLAFGSGSRLAPAFPAILPRCIRARR